MLVYLCPWLGPILTTVRCTSSFVDDVMFSYGELSRPEWKVTRMFRPVRQVAAPKVRSSVSDCILFISFDWSQEAIVAGPKFTLPRYGAKYCDQRVCLSVRSHISKATCPNITKFSVHVNCGCGSFFPQYVMYFRFCGWHCVFTWWRQWSRIKHDVMFRPVRQVAKPGRSLMFTIALF